MKHSKELQDQGATTSTPTIFILHQRYLIADLRSKGFGACGTLRMNRRGIPPAIKPTIEKGATKVVNVDWQSSGRTNVKLLFSQLFTKLVLSVWRGGTGMRQVDARMLKSRSHSELLSASLSCSWRPWLSLLLSSSLRMPESVDFVVITVWGESETEARLWAGLLLLLLQLLLGPAAVKLSLLIFSSFQLVIRKPITSSRFNVLLVKSLISALLLHMRVHFLLHATAHCTRNSWSCILFNLRSLVLSQFSWWVFQVLIVLF